jgi:hypothetical protein
MSHPYRHIPDQQRWSRAMSDRAIPDIDPVGELPFRIDRDTRVVTAGSCFAQHVARYMRAKAVACLETEPAHPLLDADLAHQYNYGVYAARYGNIYTARQLLQLWRRANGSFIPAQDVWENDGAWFDPFRPAIQPGGFASWEEFQADRRQHFAAVRKAFSSMDVMIFTLGLTECWASRRDGAVYPLCPGVAAGTFDPAEHVFVNLSLDEVVNDLTAFVTEVREVNPGMRLILTVSPVPLAATAESRHVLQSNTYSKAVLRVAAEQVSRLPGVCYFPAYEIISAAGDRYFESDRRTLAEAGIQQVMSLFFRHMLAESGPAMEAADDGFLDRARSLMDAICDEQRLDPRPDDRERQM